MEVQQYPVHHAVGTTSGMEERIAEIIDIQESRKNNFFVTTRTDDEYLQYIVVKKNNKYLIDSKKRKFLSEDKWSVDYL